MYNVKNDFIDHKHKKLADIVTDILKYFKFKMLHLNTPSTKYSGSIEIFLVNLSLNFLLVSLNKAYQVFTTMMNLIDFSVFGKRLLGQDLFWHEKGQL